MIISFKFLACPDFKGIKTLGGMVVVVGQGFWPALISKGLRLLGRHCFQEFQFLACPDFKGIKTDTPVSKLHGAVSGLP